MSFIINMARFPTRYQLFVFVNARYDEYNERDNNERSLSYKCVSSKRFILITIFLFVVVGGVFLLNRQFLPVSRNTKKFYKF